MKHFLERFDMTKPKLCLINPKDFGKKLQTDWVEDKSTEEIAASAFQHRYCVEMRKQIKKKYGTIREYCIKTNQSYQRLGQILRGDTVLNGNDIGIATACLGISMDVVSEDHLTLAAHTKARDAVGAFYTPDNVSSYMVNRLGILPGSKVLEPSFGDGSFLRALKEAKLDNLSITACEIDQAACRMAISSGLVRQNELHYGSLFDLGDANYDAAIGNPPYVRLR